MDSGRVRWSQVESDGVRWRWSECTASVFFSAVVCFSCGVVCCWCRCLPARANADPCQSVFLLVAVQRAPCFQLTADCNEAPDRLAAHRAVCINAESGGV